jgi:hypothetical protein
MQTSPTSQSICVNALGAGLFKSQAQQVGIAKIDFTVETASDKLKRGTDMAGLQIEVAVNPRTNNQHSMLMNRGLIIAPKRQKSYELRPDDNVVVSGRGPLASDRRKLALRCGGKKLLLGNRQPSILVKELCEHATFGKLRRCVCTWLVRSHTMPHNPACIDRSQLVAFMPPSR